MAKYKIEVMESGKWADAGWTEHNYRSNDVPSRYDTREEAQEALEAFFADVRNAVTQGSIDREEDPSQYRIVEAPATDIKVCSLSIRVRYDAEVASPYGIADALGILLESALSTRRLLDDVGNPLIGQVDVEDEVVNDEV